MPYDEDLFQRLYNIFKKTKGIQAKKMFGGICFMHRGNMVCGIDGQRLMVRVGPDQHDYALSLKHAKFMDITGKPMKGFIFVERVGFKSKRELEKWINLGLNFTSTLPVKKPKSRKVEK